MTSQHFKDSARQVASMLDNAGITYDVYSLLNLTDSLLTTTFNFTPPPTPNETHEILVRMALRSAYVLEMMQAERKIMAIKELRDVAIANGVFDSTCGTLSPTKRAVEDSRVTAAAALWSNPWTNHHDSDEPQF